MHKIFLDCDVSLDLFLKREPHFESAENLFSQIENKKIKGYTSGLVFSNLSFILSKTLNRKEAFKILQKLNLLISISPVNSSTVEKALASNFTDFEDAIQNYSAIERNVDYLITRNKKDYKHSILTILTPSEYLSLLN